VSASLPTLTLILGGIRSGKSERAEALVRGSGLPVVYLATARPLDGEMRARIARHRARRDPAWRLVEAPLDLADALAGAAGAGRVVLVDGLGVWLANLLVELGGEADVRTRLVAFREALLRAAGPVVVVSEEVGLAPVPADSLTRRFADLLGDLNRWIAGRAQRVELVVAGLSLVLRGPRDSFE